MSPADFDGKAHREDIALQFAIERAKEAASKAISIDDLAYLLGVEIHLLKQEKERPVVTELSS